MNGLRCSNESHGLCRAPSVVIPCSGVQCRTRGLPRVDDFVLDIGCGTGSFLARLASPLGVRRTLGLDISQSAVASVAARGIPVVRGGMHWIPFKDGQFDFIFARHALDQVPAVPEALVECRRALGRSG
ncbi:class I SAM-dependent methyltransferase [Streptomyces fructofermentans]|uniref:class I SAM-dependent methyltransferase n=1 Tax=Streptomyces fructofermentans TaxID=152141 RepID=UPI0033C7F831